MSDPFGTAALRESVLASWRDSPTRFREDANTEEDLRLGAYRDRMLVELAQNAADAAAAAAIAGTLRITAEGNELRVANTGAPLDADGVAALASLRASAKREGHQIGRFGVGFAAVVTVSSAPRIVSTTGGVAFSAERTRAAVAGLDRLAPILADRSDEVPVLRLPWPTGEDEAPVPDGYTTEVRLPLRPGIDPLGLLDTAGAAVPDLLLALPSLVTVIVGERVWRRIDGPDRIVEVRGPDSGTRWLTHRAAGTLTPAETGELGVEARPDWRLCWAVPLNAAGAPARLDGPEVLHAPTPTDEKLSLPARLLATVPIEPSRRRLRPGPATDAVLRIAAAEYAKLVAELPAEHRTALVPLPAFPLSEVDGTLRSAITDALTTAEWLPTAGNGERTPAGSVVLDIPDPELAEALAEVVPGLLAGWLAEKAHAPALAALGVRRLRPAEIVAAVSGVDRPHAWWRALYSGLARLVEADGAVADELGALPVPLIDGRIATGPRDVLLPSGELAELAESLSDVDISGLRVAHPDVVHPLLERLGAHQAGTADLLDSPAIRDAVAHSKLDADAGADPRDLADTVLALVEAVGAYQRDWLSALALPDSDGEVRRADELVLPNGPLLAVLAEDAVGRDAPLGVLAEDVAQRWPAEVLTAIGVADGFETVLDEEPAGPDHDLSEEADWWEWCGDRPPTVVLGIRDLDLVADDAWPAALRLLASRPETARALADPRGHTTWWLARYALLAGRAPREWRLPSADGLTGLYDPLPELGLDEGLAAMAGVRRGLAVGDAEDATDLLDRLGDPQREVPPGLAMLVHAELAEAALEARILRSEVDPPERLRTVAGTTIPVADAVILDRPWFYGVLAEDELVAVGTETDEQLAAALGELCDADLAGDVIGAGPSSAGELVGWTDLGAVRMACSLLGVDVPEGGVTVHEELLVGDTPVPWWVDGGEVHAEDSPDGLARALAWTLDRYPDRWLLAGVLADPTEGTILR